MYVTCRPNLGIYLLMRCREHRQALESRIHHLESQLAAHVSAPMHGLESLDQSLMGGISTIDWQTPPPPLTVNTTFATPYDMGSDFDMAPFSASSVPSIAISEAQPSPVPSFWSGTTRASSPERHPTSAPHMPFTPGMETPSQAFSPPIRHHHSSSLSWDFMTPSEPGHLKPEPSTSHGRSRTTSISSVSADSEGATSSNYDEQSGGMDIGSLNLLPYPSRFEAETLTSEFLRYVETMPEPKPYTLPSVAFGRLYEAVYPSPNSNSGQISQIHQSVPIHMARFHVFLAMAIGMKFRIRDSAEPTNLLLDRCYELAMQQAAASTFWLEPGAVEAAQLVAILASVGKEGGLFQPRSLQASCTW